ncbi:TIGR02679 domain-containing protein [Nocardia sp. CWNU-33]|uniref:TIGR02679 domain-containing protein n=1 Tax=Nocardia sp. CWNU-33 TaxID=3392117 RepID=UPI00398E5D14
MRVGPLDAEQQGTIADLFGAVRLPGEYATVSLTDLDAVLNDVIGCAAYEVVEQLVGPIGDRAAERRSAAAERNRLWAWLSGHNVVRASPALETWVASTRRNGLIERSLVGLGMASSSVRRSPCERRGPADLPREDPAAIA